MVETETQKSHDKMQALLKLTLVGMYKGIESFQGASVVRNGVCPSIVSSGLQGLNLENHHGIRSQRKSCFCFLFFPLFFVSGAALVRMFDSIPKEGALFGSVSDFDLTRLASF